MRRMPPPNAVSFQNSCERGDLPAGRDQTLSRIIRICIKKRAELATDYTDEIFLVFGGSIRAYPCHPWLKFWYKLLRAITS